MSSLDQSDSSAEVFRLLDLPRELRDIIYGFTFRSDFVSPACRYTDRTGSVSGWMPSSLFRASKQIYHEALPVFLAHGRFVIELSNEHIAFQAQHKCHCHQEDLHCQEDLSYLKDEPVLHSVQNIRINVMVAMGRNTKCHMDDALNALDSAASLKSLRIGWFYWLYKSVRYPIRPPSITCVPELRDLSRIDDVRFEMPPDYTSMPEDSEIDFCKVQLTLEEFLATEAASLRRHESAKYWTSL